VLGSTELINMGVCLSLAFEYVGVNKVTATVESVAHAGRKVEDRNGKRSRRWINGEGWDGNGKLNE